MPNDVLHQSEALAQARVDIARLEAQQEGMGREIGELKDMVRALTATVNAMRDDITAAKGGWRTLMLLGGASASAGGAITWLLQHLPGVSK